MEARIRELLESDQHNFRTLDTPTTADEPGFDPSATFPNAALPAGEHRPPDPVAAPLPLAGMLALRPMRLDVGLAVLSASAEEPSPAVFLGVGYRGKTGHGRSADAEPSADANRTARPRLLQAGKLATPGAPPDCRHLGGRVPRPRLPVGNRPDARRGRQASQTLIGRAGAPERGRYDGCRRRQRLCAYPTDLRQCVSHPGAPAFFRDGRRRSRRRRKRHRSGYDAARRHRPRS